VWISGAAIAFWYVTKVALSSGSTKYLSQIARRISHNCPPFHKVVYSTPWPYFLFSSPLCIQKRGNLAHFQTPAEMRAPILQHTILYEHSDTRRTKDQIQFGFGPEPVSFREFFALLQLEYLFLSHSSFVRLFFWTFRGAGELCFQHSAFKILAKGMDNLDRHLIQLVARFQ